MKILRVIPVFFIYILMSACATMNVDLAKMGSEDVGALAMTIYEKRYAEHQSRAELPNLSNAEKQDLQNLKGALVNIYPHIKSYNTVTDNGFDPSIADRQALMSFIRDYYYKE